MSSELHIRLLMVEDAATDAELAVRQLRRDGIRADMRRVEDRAAFVAALEAEMPDLILSDYALPGFGGLEALAIAQACAPDVPFLFLSGTIGEETAIEALKRGAIDYVLKSNLTRLSPAVRRALDEARTRAAHRSAERRFRDLIEHAPHAIAVFNHEGRIEIVNARLEQLFGWRREELAGKRSDALLPGRYADWLEQLRAGDGPQAAGTVTPLCFECESQARDGRIFPVEVSLSPLNTEDGMWISGVIRDITERRAQEARIARLSRIHAVLSGINTAIVRIRERGRFLDEACRIAVEAGGFAAAWIGLPDSAAQRIEPVAWAGLEDDFVQGLEISTEDGVPHGLGPSAVALRTRGAAMVNDVGADPSMAPWRARLLEQGLRSACAIPLVIGNDATGVLVLYARQRNVFNEEELRLLTMVASDIAFALDRFGKEEQINYLAFFDPLTSLPNRSLFLERLEQTIAHRVPGQDSHLAVVFLDLDRFRNFNESFGRAATDGLLREAARRLGSVLPEPRSLARIHADRFAFIVDDVRSEADIVHLLEEKVAGCLDRPVAGFETDVRLSATAGIVFHPADGVDAETLLRNAEAALKNAKSARMPYLFYTAAMNARAAEKLSIENRLRRAVEEGQFVLHYQPKVDLASGRIAGLEALIRWQEPGGELVQPDRFIHILEETGMIVDVGYWVIDRAHRQAREWAARGIAAPRIAVNVSQMQIRQKDFVGHVLAMLEADAHRDLELEITESLFMEGNDQEAARAKLARLRESGITMAIDDFGTGYSSLSYIAHLPIDTLKIDRSFVSDMTTSADHMAIVSTIISLAHALDLKVVAEGVETEEQYRLLKSLECDQVQGFYYGRTVPPEEIERRLLAQQGVQLH